jgi:hypothetical protein
LAHVQDGNLRNEFYTAKYHVYTRLCIKSYALEWCAAVVKKVPGRESQAGVGSRKVAMCSEEKYKSSGEATC